MDPQLRKKRPKSAVIRARVDATLKHDAEALLDKWGMTITQAMNMVLKNIVEHEHWPYVYRQFNAQTIADLDVSKQDKELASFNNVDEMITDLHVSLDEDNEKDA